MTTRFIKADYVMVCCEMVRNGRILVSELQELVSSHSGKGCSHLSEDGLLFVFCIMARNEQIPESEVEELVCKYDEANTRCVCVA